MQIRSQRPRRRLGLLIRRSLQALGAIILGYLLVALIGAALPGRYTELASGDAHTIYLLRGPIHYDFLVPLDAPLKERFEWLDLDLEHPGADGLVIGWGGHEFYTTTGTYRDVSLGAVWKGVTGDASVMRVALAGPMQADWPVTPITMSALQYEAFLRAITNSFAAQEALRVPGFSEFDAFYPAQGRFNIFRTCNVWIGETLRKAGLAFGTWTPAPYAVTLSARWHLDSSVFEPT